VGIYFGSGGRELIIDEPVMVRLADATALLKEKTGQGIDLYRDTNLYPDHAALWITGLRELEPGLRGDKQGRQRCRELIAFLEQAVAEDDLVVISGE
jgi:hypothetical protein